MSKKSISKTDKKSELTHKSKAQKYISDDILAQSKKTFKKVVKEQLKDLTIPKSPKVKEVKLEDALKKSLEYFNGDELAAKVWTSKYALKDSEGNLFEENPEDMHKRIAREVARIEKTYPNPMSYKEIFSLLDRFKYIIPQGSPMAGIGNNFQKSSLSNCFVIGNESNSDSYGGIMKIDQEQVQLMKRRGGVGHDLSHIRPQGSKVNNSALTSTGLVPFMERYSNSTREVAQDGRRGALMLSVSVKHPDSERFIDAKMEQGKVTGANISVKLDDEFMKSVINETDYKQQYPLKSKNPKYSKNIEAKKLWDKIIHNAWASAEPGVLFWDTIINESVADCYADQGFETVSTNPCGEIPLCPYDSCRLLAINLYSYVEKPFTKEASFNWNKFNNHIAAAQRIMDDIIDLEIEKIDAILEKIDSDKESDEIKSVERNLWNKIKEKAVQGRRTGVGITAEGDMLAAMGLRYGTSRATDFSLKVHKNLAIEAYKTSAILAKERGSFPIFDLNKEKNNPLINRIKVNAPDVYQLMEKYGRRNISLLTIAPTGSVSICTQTTSGIEPAFLISYKRRKKVNPNDKDVTVSFVDELGDAWEEYNVFHNKFLVWLEANGYDKDEVTKMDEENLQEIIKKSPYYKATSADVDWLEKVRMQGKVQKWIDHSISVTVNLPKEATEELVSKVYKTAWESGCKGMTIYRDGSRDGVLVVSNDSKKEKVDENGFAVNHAPKRLKTLEAKVLRFQNQKEKWIAFVGLMDSKPYEIFTGKADDILVPNFVEQGEIIKVREERKDGKIVKRYDFKFQDKHGYDVTLAGLSRSFDKEYWNYAKLISGVLRHGMPLPKVIKLIENLDFDLDIITTWKNGVIRSLKKFIPDGTTEEKEKCPECSQVGTLTYVEGCLACADCGYSKCG